MILALDPGDRTGYAVLSESGEVLGRGILQDLDKALDFISWAQRDIDTVLIEDYVLFKSKAKQQSGSRFVAVQVIGAAKLRARQLGAEVHMIPQEAHIMGSFYTGEKGPSDHKQGHDTDAYNLGIWWMVDQGIVQAKDLPGALQLT